MKLLAKRVIPLYLYEIVVIFFMAQFQAMSESRNFVFEKVHMTSTILTGEYVCNGQWCCLNGLWHVKSSLSLHRHYSFQFKPLFNSSNNWILKQNPANTNIKWKIVEEKLSEVIFSMSSVWSIIKQFVTKLQGNSSGRMYSTNTSTHVRTLPFNFPDTICL